MPPSRSCIPKRRRLPTEYNKNPCPVCGETVKYVRDVERHKMKHAPNKEELKVRCPLPNCDYATLQKSNVTVHACKQHKLQVYHCQPSCNFCALEWIDLAKHQKDLHGIEHDITKLEKLASSAKEQLPEVLPATEPQKSSRKRQPKTQHRLTNTPCHGIDVAQEDATGATYQYGEYGPNDGSNISSFPGWLPHNQVQAICDGSPTEYNTAYFQGQLHTQTEPPVDNILQSTSGPILQAIPQTSGYSLGYNSYYAQGTKPASFAQHPMGSPLLTWDGVFRSTAQSSSQTFPVTPFYTSLPSYDWNEHQKLLPSTSIGDVEVNALGDIASWDTSSLDPNFVSSLKSDNNGQFSTPLVQDTRFDVFERPHCYTFPL